MTAKVRDIPSEGKHTFWCEPCNTHMWFDDKRWAWNGDYEKPTVSPSILWRGAAAADSGTSEGVCHLFIEGGQIRYLSDCTHSLAGQTVPMWELP